MDTLTFKVYRSGSLIQAQEFTQRVIKIGKLDSSHLRIDDEHVSRMHAVIEVNGAKGTCIIDLGSAMGTVVNGEQINKCKIEDGDELLLGNIRVEVGVVGATRAEPVVLGPQRSRSELKEFRKAVVVVLNEYLNPESQPPSHDRAYRAMPEYRDWGKAAEAAMAKIRKLVEPD